MNVLRRVVALASVVAIWTSVAAAQGFQSVYSENGVDVWAVGDAGVIYRSLDGGLHWSSSTPYPWDVSAVAAREFTALVPGVAGRIMVSHDSGASWTVHLLTGLPNLHGVAMPSDTVAYVVGANGTIAKSTDAGDTWTPQSSGTTYTLRAVSFEDELTGWAVGDGGTVCMTDDGGANWSPVYIGTSADLHDVKVKGSDVWIAGARATLFHSDNGGMSFGQLDLQLDAYSDVNAIAIVSPDSVVIGGGGGFIWISGDAGANWEFPVHSLHGRLSSLWAAGGSMWAVSSVNQGIVLSQDQGATWQMPTGMLLSRSWVLKFSFAGGVRGHAIDFDRDNPDILFAALGADVYRSVDAGETWSHYSDFPVTFNRCNALLVSPYDSDVMLAAVSGNYDRIIRTIDGGATWISTLALDFGEYGIPLEMHPDHPDTVYFGPDNRGLYRSQDFGASWELIGVDSLRSPCDIVVVPGHADTILVGDGVTGSGQGQYLRSTDGGVHMSVQQTQPIGASEIPGMASSRLRPAVCFGTNWGSGGVQRSLDYGATWPTIDTHSSAWGVDVSRDDPNCMVFGLFAGLKGFLSDDGGDSFTETGMQGANYSFFIRDRGLILAQQSTGIYKLAQNYNYTPNNAQSLAITYPTGGETFAPGSMINIQWIQTNVPMVTIEYRANPADPFTPIAAVPGYAGSYTWEVPYTATNEAQFRLREAIDDDPLQIVTNITIALPLVDVTPGDLDFGNVPVGGTLVIPVTIENTGTATLDASAIATSTAEFVPGRTSLSLAPGVSDTIGVLFEPATDGMYADTLVITSNGYNMTTWKVPLTGESISGPFVLLDAPNGGEVWQYNTIHDITWQAWNMTNVQIDYQLNPTQPWESIVASTPAALGTYAWTIPATPSDETRVRVREAGGSAEAISAADFSLAVPFLIPVTNPHYIEQTLVGATTTEVLQINNPGNGPLTISSIVGDNPSFWVGRTSMVIPPRTVDTTSVSFNATFAGPDSAVFTVTSDDPSQPHYLEVHGIGVNSVAVGDQRATAFALRQNQPNPFGVMTTIRYALPVESDVSLDVFDLQGQRVATLVDGHQQAGVHSVTFGIGRSTASGGRSSLPAGVYFYRLEAGGFVATRKMLLVN